MTGRNRDQYGAIPVAYYGSLQYRRLERINGTPDYLDQIIRAKP